MAKQNYLQVFISCENTQQGMALAQALIEERLIFGARYSAVLQSSFGKTKSRSRTIRS